MASEEEIPVVNGPWQLLYHYANKQGVLVFGLISCLLIWVIMVQPELNRNAAQNEVLQKAIQELRNQTEVQKELASHSKMTAQILDRIITRLDAKNVD